MRVVKDWNRLLKDLRSFNAEVLLELCKQIPVRNDADAGTLQDAAWCLELDSHFL